jgi:hypothetical protein
MVAPLVIECFCTLGFLFIGIVPCRRERCLLLFGSKGDGKQDTTECGMVRFFLGRTRQGNGEVGTRKDGKGVGDYF